MSQIGDGPVEKQYETEMRVIASGLDRMLNGENKGLDCKVGFVLLVFPFGETHGARCNFVSNGDRRDIVNVLKEMVARFEGQPEMQGHA